LKQGFVALEELLETVHDLHKVRKSEPEAAQFLRGALEEQTPVH